MQEKQYLVNKNNFVKFAHVKSIPVFEHIPQKNVRFTISIPTYQRVRTLEDAINSAINQTFKDYHIVVVDNNPIRNDETEQYMMTFKDNHRISYYKNAENIGLYGNWNRCIELAKGEWVTLLHDDDFYFPEYLATYDRYLKKYPQIQSIYCKHISWIEKDHQDNISNIEREKLPEKLGVCKIWPLILFFNHIVGPVGICYKRDNVIELGGFNLDIYPSADYDFHIRYLRAYNIYVLNSCMVHYRIGLNVYGKPETQDDTIVQDWYIGLEFCKYFEAKKILITLKEYQLNENIVNFKTKFPQFKPNCVSTIPFRNYNAFAHLCYAKYYWWVYRYWVIFVSKFHYIK